MTSPWMVVRVRGSIHARHDIVETLQYLHLTRPNHATVVPNDAGTTGMLHKVQGYVTWGEADPATVELLLAQRGETPDGAKLSAGDGAAIAELSKSVVASGLSRTPGVRPLFRLRAPKGGWRSTKKPFALGGALGYRGEKINELVRRMV
jgi:large subunit ribosomal protein L30